MVLQATSIEIDIFNHTRGPRHEHWNRSCCWYPMEKIDSFLDVCKSVKHGFQIHTQIIIQGLNQDIITTTRLISLMALSATPAGVHHSRLLFFYSHHQLRNNVYLWNTIIRGYSRSQTPLHSFLLFKSMLSSVSPNNYTFPFLINSCAKLSTLHSGQQIHSWILKTGYSDSSDVYINNSLIHFYSSFGCLQSAQKVFDTSCQRDVVSFNTMINACARNGRPNHALQLFLQMLSRRDSDSHPDDFTMVALSSAASSLNDPNIGKVIHLFAYKFASSSTNSNGLLNSALVDMYAKCGKMEMAHRVFSSMGTSQTATASTSLISGYASSGDIDPARRVFDQMKHKDLVAWTTMINAYSQSGMFSDAMELFLQMEAAGIQPDDITLVAALSACARLGALGIGQRLHQQYVNNHGFMIPQNVILATATVDMYAKCGNLDTALSVFNGVQPKTRTVTLCNVMIYALAQHGDSDAAMAIFQEMEAIGLRPDGITFVGLLYACSHGGLVEEGKVIFDSMLDLHEIEPKTEHYCCLVDIFGRSGRVEEAYDIIQKMPFHANSVIWRSLLGSCNMHGNVRIGQMAAERLIELDPDHGARDVVLSNILTTANRWEDAGRVREQMEYRGISKPPGWSYIEVNGTPHRFQASDRSHLQNEDIKLMLEDMTRKLKSVGYVPDTTRVLFDMDDEERETLVNYHSEKIALAFGLINLDPQAIIRIVKNLRICVDCHSAFKLCSKIYRRFVVVRDTTRFHHFKNGLCSCKDFW